MISVVILTKNEESNIDVCINSANFADEIIVVDDFSHDSTIKKIKGKKVKVFKRKLDDFSSQRNYGIAHATKEWILFLDADERVTSALRDEILETIKTDSYTAASVLRTDIVWGRELLHGEVGHIRLVRLFKKGQGKWTGLVHETLQVKGNVKKLINPLKHYPHSSISEFLSDIDLYSSLRTEELYKEKKSVSVFSIVLYPLGKFIHNYFLRGGYKDNIPGLLYAVMMSFHSFLVRSKLYFLIHK